MQESYSSCIMGSSYYSRTVQSFPFPSLAAIHRICLPSIRLASSRCKSDPMCQPGRQSRMSRSLAALMVTALLVITLGAVSADDKTKKKKDKEDSTGAVWEYKVTKDKKEESGLLQV